jgi:tetrahydromethanopterin S-methyltransferase subunit F
MLGVYTIVQTSESGLLSLRTGALGALSIALLGGFVVRQARGRNPILPLRILRSRSVAGANLVQALMSTSFLGFFFLGSLDLERVQGYGPMAIGLAFLPVAVVMALFSVRFSAQLIGRFGAPAMLFAGLTVAGIALAAVALAPVHPSYAVNLLLPMALLGLGGGLCFPALTMIAMADVAAADAGLASGLLNTTGQVGGAFGLAVLATVAGGRTLDLVRDGMDVTAALSGGFHLAWAVCTAVVVVTIGVAVALLRPRGVQAEAVADDCVECEAAA